MSCTLLKYVQICSMFLIHVQDELYIVMEYVSEKLLTVNFPPPQNKRSPALIMRQLLEAVDFLNNVVGASHHDLKTPNTMMLEKTSELQICCKCSSIISRVVVLVLEVAL